MESPEEVRRNMEKMITARIIQEDTESIYSLLKTERDSIFAMEIIPYYALFVQSIQEYMGATFVESSAEKKIKDIRNFIKVYGEGFGKTKKRIDAIDIKQNEQFKSQLRFDFMKNWNIHLNLGTYWTEDKHIIGNTQMFADFLEIDDIFDSKTGKVQYDFAVQISSFVASIRTGFSEVIYPPMINRCHIGESIAWYYDLNTNMNDKLFPYNSTKPLNLFFLNITCNMNFVKYILRPLFEKDNKWVFRIEYIVTYYSYRAIERLRKYCENNIDLQVDLGEFMEIFKLANYLFNTKFRNCMMHYGLENRDVISMENIEKPFYGISETCNNGMDFYSFLNKLRNLTDSMIVLLENKFNMEEITLQHL